MARFWLFEKGLTRKDIQGHFVKVQFDKLMNSTKAYREEYAKEKRDRKTQESKMSIEIKQIISKDKKLADCLEALVGVTAETCGLKTTISFLNKLEILNDRFSDLGNILELEMENVSDNHTNVAVNFIYENSSAKKIEELLKYEFN